mgnify:CR=1 FL=1
MDFQDFKDLNLSEIEKWKHMQLSDEEIKQWKKDGSLVDKLFEFKMRKVYLEYLKVKMENIEAQVDPFNNYDPIHEAQKILKRYS